MNLFMQLLRDEHGFVLSAEMALLGTVGVIGATVGLTAVTKSVNEELIDVAMAFRSLDQSYHFEGASGCGACTAGSCYTQPPVEESLKKLTAEVEEAQAHEKKHHDAESHEKGHKHEKDHKHDDKDHKAHDKDGDPQPPSTKKPNEDDKPKDKPDDKSKEMKKREELKKKRKEQLEKDED